MVETGMETSQSVDPRMPSAECSAPPFADSACDLVTVPTRQGLEAVDILRRGACDGVGPVLHDDGDGTLGFLVPPGTAAAWDVPGSTCTGTHGRGLRLAPDPEPPVEGSDWLLPPGGADLATDPAVLRAALGEAARLIEAADGCR
ncbi:hypothetical protein OH768_32715 [Streptomyces sp. NBC_01622]|uniref:hypothetical protein n=1 Tax=Streptomyces sp. NBC_01622 TaxID=2975903 RepID=UPI00386C8686|nr:hypothetical protein OH768_32715 [Streptomyces sp. NBC_01622]